MKKKPDDIRSEAYTERKQRRILEDEELEQVTDGSIETSTPSETIHNKDQTGGKRSKPIIKE